MEVIGEDGYTYVVGEDDELEGDVMGDVMGYQGPMGDFEGSAMVGYDDEGNQVLVGARKRRRRPGRARILVKKPNWRKSQVAPGVIAPDQGMLSLPMPGIQGNTYSAALNAITFQGELQKPFRGERLLVSVVRTGVTAVGRLMGQIFVGTDLQQGDIPALDIENLGNPAAFGIRLTMKPAQPGVKIRIQTNLSIVLAGADTIFADVQLLGRIVQ